VANLGNRLVQEAIERFIKQHHNKEMVLAAKVYQMAEQLPRGKL
jgi:hypothetical protein